MKAKRPYEHINTPNLINLYESEISFNPLSLIITSIIIALMIKFLTLSFYIYLGLVIFFILYQLLNKSIKKKLIIKELKFRKIKV